MVPRWNMIIRYSMYPLLFFTLLASDCITSKHTLSVLSLAADVASNQKLALGSFYELEDPSVTPNADFYSLPLSLEQITNLQKITFELNSVLPGHNEFVSIPWHGNDIAEPYKTSKT